MFKSVNTTGATSGIGLAYPSGAPEFNPSFYWVSCYSIFRFLCNVLLIVVCLFVPFFSSLYFLFFFDLPIVITPLVSSKSSVNNSMSQKLH